MKPPLAPRGDLPLVEWAIHSLNGLVLTRLLAPYAVLYRYALLQSHPTLVQLYSQW